MPDTKLKVKSEKLKVEAKSVVKTAPKKNSLSIDVLDVKGKVVESLALSEKIFGNPINKKLIAQAVRVYLANQRSGTASTKTRGEVEGSTRKIYKQKGTGRARHGGIRAPIFVKGGIAFGPKPRDYSLKMPQKMRKVALFSVLSGKLKDGEIKVVVGLEKLEPKTKVMVKVLEVLGLKIKEKTMIVLPGSVESVARGARNIPGVTYVHANQLNTYEALNTKTIIFLKDSLAVMEKTFLK